MAKVTITNPQPFQTNRRKCGWGSALTTCDICGKIMMGHNRGICSKCMRAQGIGRRDTIFTPQRAGIRHLVGIRPNAEKKLIADGLRKLYAGGEA